MIKTLLIIATTVAMLAGPTLLVRADEDHTRETRKSWEPQQRDARKAREEREREANKTREAQQRDARKAREAQQRDARKARERQQREARKEGYSSHQDPMLTLPHHSRDSQPSYRQR